MREWIILFLNATGLNLFMLFILNLGENGEAGGEAGAGAGGEAGAGGGEQTFTQTQVNSMMADHKRGMQTDLTNANDRISEMQKKLEGFTTAEQSRATEQLEAGKEYDKLKEGWVTKEGEYKGVIDGYRGEISGMKISSALVEQIIAQNAHADVVQLIKPFAQIGEDGVVKIKGKNASGVEDLLSVEEGLKSFLKERPYLVKASGSGGSGTPPAGAAGGESGGGNGDPLQDSKDLEAAMKSGDRKQINAIRARIGAKRAGAQQSALT